MCEKVLMCTGAESGLLIETTVDFRWGHILKRYLSSLRWELGCQLLLHTSHVEYFNGRLAAIFDQYLAVIPLNFRLLPVCSLQGWRREGKSWIEIKSSETLSFWSPMATKQYFRLYFLADNASWRRHLAWARSIVLFAHFSEIKIFTCITKLATLPKF